MRGLYNNLLGETVDDPHDHSGRCRLLEVRHWDLEPRLSVACGKALCPDGPVAEESSAEEVASCSRGQTHARVSLFGKTRYSSNLIPAVKRDLKAAKVPSEAQSRGPLDTLRETGYCSAF
jgi:hypothetical protein